MMKAILLAAVLAAAPAAPPAPPAEPVPVEALAGGGG